MPVTVATNTNYSAIAATFVNGDSITVNNGATFTIDTQPASGVYFGDIIINEGKFLADASTVNTLTLFFQETKQLTGGRLATFETLGKYYEIGTSSGAASQTFTIPTTVTVSHVEVETSAGSGVYETWGNLYDVAFAQAGAGELGKVCLQTLGSATLAFGNGTNGAIPPTGTKIRMFNVLFASCTTAAPTAPSMNATATTRWRTSNFTGLVKNRKTYFCGIYLNYRFTYLVDFVDVGCIGTALMDTVSGVLTWIRATFCFEALRVLGCAFNWTDCNSYRNANSANNRVFFEGSNGKITGGKWNAFSRIAANHVLLFTNGSNNIVVDGCTIIGHGIKVLNANNVEVKNIKYSDSTTGIANTVNNTADLGIAIYWLQASNVSCSNLSLLTGGTSPPRAFLEGNFFSNAKIQDIGTPTNPLNFNNNPVRFFLVNGAGINNLSLKRIYLTNPYSGTIFASATNPSVVEAVLQNISFGIYTKALPLLGNNQIIKGSQFSSTFGNTGIPTNISILGTHFYDGFTSATTGAVGILFCESSGIGSSLTAYVLESANASNPAVFNGLGNLLLRTSGDRVTYTRPYYLLGHSTITGNNFDLTGTFTIEYDLDKNNGLGFSGVWKPIANISTETVSATGWREKLRFTASTTSANNTLRGFYLSTTTTQANQEAATYIDSTQATLTIEGIVNDSELVIKYPRSNLILYKKESTGVLEVYTYQHTGLDFRVDVWLYKEGYQALVVRNYLLTANNQTLGATQTRSTAWKA